jgi:hypothetical protein
LMIPVVPVYHHVSTSSLPKKRVSKRAKAGRLGGGMRPYYDIERACQ